MELRDRGSAVLSRALLLLLATLPLAGCGDATSPAELAGTYVLETVNGQPTPVVVASSVEEGPDVTRHREVEILGGSTEIRPSGAVLVGVLGAVTVTEDGSSSTDSGNDTAVGELDDGAIVFADDTILVADRPFLVLGGSAGGDAVTVRLARTAGAGPEVLLRYTR